MVRSWFAGMLWGAMLSLLGLIAVSLAMPLPTRVPVMADGGAERPVAAAPTDSGKAAPDLPKQETAVPVPQTVVTNGDGAAPVSSVPEQDPVVSEAPTVIAVPAPTAPSPLPEAEAKPPEPRRAEVPAGAVPVLPPAPVPQTVDAAPVARAPMPPADVAAQAPPEPLEPAGAGDLPTLPQPSAPPPTAAAPALPDRTATDPAADPVTLLPSAPDAAEAPVPVPEVADAAVPVPEVADPPRPGLTGQVDGVRTGRLPRIEATPDPAPADSAAPAETDGTARGALARNAVRFDNPLGKPPLAVLLLDTGDSAVDLRALATGPVPVTLVIDPSDPDGAARAAEFAAAGGEVAIGAGALPRRGQAADFEVALEALVAQVPQALAIVEQVSGELPETRALVSALMPALAARGFGLVRRDRGLGGGGLSPPDPAVPAVAVFREIDDADEAAPVIRRYLDRAAFEAQKIGHVVVMGRLRPETVAALADWSTGNRAASVAAAPLSGVLLRR